MHYPNLIGFLLPKPKYGYIFMTFCLHFQRRAVPLRSTCTFMIDNSKKLLRRTKLRLNVVLAHEQTCSSIWNRKFYTIVGVFLILNLWFKIMLPVRTVDKTVTRCPVILTVKKIYVNFFCLFGFLSFCLLNKLFTVLKPCL